MASDDDTLDRASAMEHLRDALIGLHVRNFLTYGLCWCDAVNPHGAGLAPNHTAGCRAAKAALERTSGYA